ncbi:MAG: hypothetical protein IPN20_04430 [Haliscomenobacter sp.]|nr:hypothetical protein [Haliscomenobacter sp.]
MKIRLTQIDGKLPNLALMKLSHFYKSNGHEVFFHGSITRSMFEPDYDLVFGSTIFSSSEKKVQLFRHHFPSAIIGGTGSNEKWTVEDFTGEYNDLYDYSIYPNYRHSIGFSQRGCRLRCKFCVVPQKEGKNKSANNIYDIWRGDGHPKNLMLLDNDYYGQDSWREKSKIMRDGGFKVCWSQGLNIRLFDKEQAEDAASQRYYDDSFQRKRIYTAYDNISDTAIFFRGIKYLTDAGVKPDEIMVYFLCNYWQKGLTTDVWERFNRMKEIGLRPYPMVYDIQNADAEIKAFQTWVIRRAYMKIPFSEYHGSGYRKPAPVLSLFPGE